KIDDVYGFCLGRDTATGTNYAILNGKNGVMQQFRLVDTAGRFTTELVREYTFPSQTEGMVADEARGWLYVGEEAAGIWKLPLVPKGNDAPRLVTAVADNPALVADVEGLTLVETGPESGYLVASIQGNFTYAVFDRAGDNEYLGSFKIGPGDSCDMVEETDGLDGVSLALPGFPGGALVVQDGFNFDGDTLRAQNFKYVDWGEVLRALNLE
ncbi:MAG: phytase, partial [Bacteroidota bacterium]